MKKGNTLVSVLIILLILLIIPVSVYLIRQATNLKSKAGFNNSRPNFVVVMVDDLDEASFNQLLDAGKLPNIKKYLVDQSIRFKNSFVTESICCSSRASFLTGKYSHNTGVYNVWGDEGGMRGFAKSGILKADSNFNITQISWLPSWLSQNGYYTGHVGKFMNTYEYGRYKKPGYDFWRNVEGYDNRPGMYAVHFDKGQPQQWPEVYQTKYISDQSTDFLNSYVSKQAENFYLEITPHSPHIAVPGWRKESNFFNSEITTQSGWGIIGVNMFNPPESNIKLRKQIIKYSPDKDHFIWQQNLTDSGWGNWTIVGRAKDLFKGTGDLPIVSFSAFVHPDTNEIRQFLTRGTLSDGYTIYYRDRLNAQNWSSWQLSTTIKSLIPQVPNLRVVSFSVTNLNAQNIVQYICMGDLTSGYYLYSRAKVNGSWTNWQKEEDLWDQGTGSNPITSFSADYVENGLIEWRVVRRDPNTNEETSYVQRLRNYWDTSVQNKVLGTTTEPLAPTAFMNEADMFTPNYQMKELPGYPDPFRSFRVTPDAGWTNFKAEQGFSKEDYGGSYPAGSLRLNNDPNGFTPISKQFDLPGIYNESFNNPGCGSKPEFICKNWPDLNHQITGGKTELDYLKRQHLDRLESMISIDVLVGKLFGQLEMKGLAENTVVVFTSDNGYFLGDYRLSNKQLPYEQSIRVPLIIKPAKSSLTSAVNNYNTALNIDLTATILDYAQLLSTYQNDLDGRSLKKILDKPTSQIADWRKWFLEEYHYPRNYDVRSWIQASAVPDVQALRSGVEATGTDEKPNILYAEYPKDPLAPQSPPWYEFYDINRDPYEVSNLFDNSKKSIDPNYSQTLSRYKSLVNELLTCKGDSCRALDSKSF